MKPLYRIKEITTGDRTFYNVQIRHSLVSFSVWSTVQDLTCEGNCDRQFKSIGECQDYINNGLSARDRKEKVIYYI